MLLIARKYELLNNNQQSIALEKKNVLNINTYYSHACFCFIFVVFRFLVFSPEVDNSELIVQQVKYCVPGM